MKEQKIVTPTTPRPTASTNHTPPQPYRESAPYLSQDEAGGRGAAVGPLQAAASGVSSSVTLVMPKPDRNCWHTEFP